MSGTQQEHGSFTLTRHYAFAPEKVFAAWSGAGKARWFAGPAGWEALIREQDFRIGGREHLRGRFPDGKVSDFQARYHDIVSQQRIIYSYEMQMNDVRMSVSLATITFQAEKGGTLLSITEQGVFLDSFCGDGPGREEGTRFLMEQINTALQNNI
ncbi:MAG: SRPBCC family protein [Moraxellaceae bacterium]